MSSELLHGGFCSHGGGSVFALFGALILDWQQEPTLKEISSPFAAALFTIFSVPTGKFSVPIVVPIVAQFVRLQMCERCRATLLLLER